MVFTKDGLAANSASVIHPSVTGMSCAMKAFNLFARALEWVFTRLLAVATAHYFDDFPHVEPSATAHHGQATMERLLRLLRWRFKESGPKAPVFGPVFNVLGVIVDLSAVDSEKVITVSNKESRVERMEADFARIVEEGFIRPPHAASIRGALNFACGQVFGSAAIPGLAALGLLSRGMTRCVDSFVLDMMDFWRQFFRVAQPRRIAVGKSCRLPLLIFTDGAAEGDSFEEVGCGAVLFDPEDGCFEYFGSAPDKATVASWRLGDQKQIIAQAEACPVLAARLTWSDRIEHRCVFQFVDHDGVKANFVNKFARHPSTAGFVAAAWSWEASLGCFSWYERVPSPGNLADGPSRKEVKGLQALGAVPVALMRLPEGVVATRIE